MNIQQHGGALCVWAWNEPPPAHVGDKQAQAQCPLQGQCSARVVVHVSHRDRHRTWACLQLAKQSNPPGSQPGSKGGEPGGGADKGPQRPVGAPARLQACSQARAGARHAQLRLGLSPRTKRQWTCIGTKGLPPCAMQCALVWERSAPRAGLLVGAAALVAPHIPVCQPSRACERPATGMHSSRLMPLA